MFSEYEKSLWNSSESLQEILHSSLKNWRLAIQAIDSQQVSDEGPLLAVTGRLRQEGKWREACLVIASEQLWLAYALGESSEATVEKLTFRISPHVQLLENEDPDVSVLEFPESGFGALAIRRNDLEKLAARIGLSDARETWIKQVLELLKSAELRGVGSHLYRIELVPSTYTVAGTTVGKNPSALKLVTLGAMGWEVVGTFPHMSGLSSNPGTQASVIHGYGMCGVVDGAYVLLRLKVEPSQLSEETPIVEVLTDIWESERRRRLVETNDSSMATSTQGQEFSPPSASQVSQVGFFGLGTVIHGNESGLMEG